MNESTSSTLLLVTSITMLANWACAFTYGRQCTLDRPLLAAYQSGAALGVVSAVATAVRSAGLAAEGSVATALLGGYLMIITLIVGNLMMAVIGATTARRPGASAG